MPGGLCLNLTIGDERLDSAIRALDTTANNPRQVEMAREIILGLATQIPTDRQKRLLSAVVGIADVASDPVSERFLNLKKDLLAIENFARVIINCHGHEIALVD